MQYKLAKDLPYGKRGEVIEVKVIPFIKYDPMIAVKCEEDIGRLISEGWIEEVKPREWELTVAKGTEDILFIDKASRTKLKLSKSEK